MRNGDDLRFESEFFGANSVLYINESQQDEDLEVRSIDTTDEESEDDFSDLDELPDDWFDGVMLGAPA